MRLELCPLYNIMMISVYSHTFFFFFQAEDGIRDIGVTGVQTCALPICGQAGAARVTRAGQVVVLRGEGGVDAPQEPRIGAAARDLERGDRVQRRLRRSEEGGVGKEGRSRWSPYH